MSQRAYNRLSDLCVLIAIGSALLFDFAGLPKYLMGTVGIVAAATAILLYWAKENSTTEPGQAKEAHQSTEVRGSSTRHSDGGGSIWFGAPGPWCSVPTIPATTIPAKATPSGALIIHRHRSGRVPGLWREERKAIYHWNLVVTDLAGYAVEVVNVSDLAGYAVEVVKALSAEREADEWELTVTHNGIVVRPRKHKTNVKQSSFAFDPLTATTIQ